LDRLVDSALEEPLVQSCRDRIEHDLVEAFLADQDAVRADLGPALVVVVAAVEPPALAGPLVVARESDEGTAARRARGDAAEEVLLLVRAISASAASRVEGAGGVQASMRGLP